MIPSKLFPKNFGYVITILCLGLIIFSILIFLYNTYLGDDVTPSDSSQSQDYLQDKGRDSGSSGGVTGEDMVITPGVPTNNNSGAKNESEQKVVKTGTLNITVDDFDDTNTSVRALAKQSGGFVTYSNDTGEGKDRSLVITVKVPAASFDSFVEKVKTYGVEVKSYSENATDVTLAYTDLQARLKNQQAVEDRLVKILDKAAKVSDILEVERQLSATQQYIEQLKAQIDYYDSQIDMSSVSITMTLNPESLDVTGDTWQPVGIFKEAVKSLVTMFKGFGSLAIWLVVFSPVFIAMYLLYKLFTRKRK